MSNGTKPVDDTIVDIEPMPTVIPRTTGVPRYSLGADFQFTERPVTQGALALVGTQDYYGQQYFTQRGNKTYYKGPGLVDGNGVIKRAPYDPYNLDTEAYRFLAGKGRGERIAFLNTLADYGLYEGGKPSVTTFDGKDLEATSKYLMELNRWGVTEDIGLAYLKNEYPGGQVKTGRTIRVTAKEDIQTVLREESFRQLGRTMTPKEVRDAVQFIQSRERQAQMGGPEQAPALSTLATQAVGRGREQEVQLEGFRTLADLIERTFGGA
jgi:hypothetical protein